MAGQQCRRPRIWWLSGILAILGAGIAIFAAMALFIVTLVTVGLALVITILLGATLAGSDQ
ncbi:MAG TPA: hypothetical protein VIG71_09650 [Enteractinococcus sp.]